MMTLDEIKVEAYKEANLIEIQWDMMDDPKHKYMMVKTMECGVNVIPDLESLYTKLSTGENVLLDGAKSSLTEDQLEEYCTFIEGELFSAYVIQEVYHKYRMVENVIALSTINRD